MGRNAAAICTPHWTAAPTGIANDEQGPAAESRDDATQVEVAHYGEDGASVRWLGERGLFS